MPDCGVHYLWFAVVCFLIRSHLPLFCDSTPRSTGHTRCTVECGLPPKMPPRASTGKVAAPHNTIACGVGCASVTPHRRKPPSAAACVTILVNTQNKKNSQILMNYGPMIIKGRKNLVNQKNNSFCAALCTSSPIEELHQSRPTLSLHSVEQPCTQNPKQSQTPSLYCHFSSFWVRKCDRNRKKNLLARFVRKNDSCTNFKSLPGMVPCEHKVLITGEEQEGKAGQTNIAAYAYQDEHVWSAL